MCCKLIAVGVGIHLVHLHEQEGIVFVGHMNEFETAPEVFFKRFVAFVVLVIEVNLAVYLVADSVDEFLAWEGT